MSILFSNEIFESIKEELSNAEKSVQIITAYCKKSTFSLLDSFVNKEVSDKRILIRFRKDDVVKGSTDFEVLEEAIGKDWNVFVRFDLHAKTYVVDNKRGFVGSANTTNSGLSIGMLGNVEMAALVDIEEKDIWKINKLFDDAVIVDSDLLEKFKKQIETVEKNSESKLQKWDSSITDLFNPKIDALFSYELPDIAQIDANIYIPFLDSSFSGDVEKLKESFRWSNAYLWLLTTLKENDGCMYFGELTEKLHNSIVSDPRPYRKDVKILLSNLLSVVDDLRMDEIIIDRPNHSQRVRLISDAK